MNTPTRTHANEWQTIGHFYAPIPYYKGKVMKYHGEACLRNLQDMLAKPGMVMLTRYHGDRIITETHEPFHGT